MTLIVKDRVKETSTSTGTGAFALAGAATGFLAFSSVMTSPSDTCYYTIQGVDSAGNPTAEWECGLGTYSAANTLTRTTVYASSNANSVVTFSAGPKQVFLDATSDYLGTKAALAGSSSQAFAASTLSTSGTITNTAASGIIDFTGANYGQFLASAGDFYVTAQEPGKKVYLQAEGANVVTVSAAAVEVIKPTTINLNAAALPTPITGTVLQLSQVDATAPILEFDSFGVNGLAVFRRAEGTNAAKTITTTNVILGGIGFRGYDGSAYTTSNNAVIQCRASSNWVAGSSYGTQLVFNVTADGATAAATALTISNDKTATFTGSVVAPVITVNAGSPGAVTASTVSDDLVIQNDAAAGLSILTPDANAGRITFGSASANANVVLYGEYNAGVPIFNVYTAGTLRTQTSAAGLAVTGAVSATAPISPGSFTLGTLPSAASYTGGQIYVSDATAGGVMCYSRGSTWLRFDTNATVA